MRRRSRRPDPFSRPFDAFLLQHRLACPDGQYRLFPEPPNDAYERAVATCPVCRSKVLTLTITEPDQGSGIVIECLNECSEGEVRMTIASRLCLAAHIELEAAAAPVAGVTA